MPKEPNDQVTLTNEEKRTLAKQRVTIIVSPFEAAIVKEIRKIPHGQLTVHILDFIPIRFTFGASHMVDPTDNMESLQE